MMYSESDHAPKAINDALDQMDSHGGIKVAKMLASVSRQLNVATVPKAGSEANPVDLDGDTPMTGVDSDKSSQPEEEDEDDNVGSDDGAWSPRSPKDWSNDASRPSAPADSHSTSATRNRIISDLCLAKDAGFRVSLQGSLLDGGREGFVTISIRVNKLGISDEALQAWHMDPKQYFVLFIRYQNGYKTLDTLIGGKLANDDVAFRMGLHEKYKVEIGDLTKVFSVLDNKTARSDQSSQSVPKIGRLFIARPLDGLLNERLLPLLRYRMAMGFPWRGAEEFLNDYQGRNLDNDAPDPKYWAEDESDKAASLPAIVMMDHLTGNGKEKSFPLVAMQFALRHLVRCTEFCLVCHCKVGEDFEALKPYVCSKPLCLYQYMSLGFGPSIEHEIISQPLVVDLLVSFCYASAFPQQLRNLPTGMALMVPAPTRIQSSDYVASVSRFAKTHGHRDPTQSREPAPAELLEGNVHKARFDPSSRDMLLKTKEKPPLQVGSWITYNPVGFPSESYHARVDEILFPTVRLSKPVFDVRNKTNTMFSTIAGSKGLMPGSNTVHTSDTLTPAPTPPASAHTTPSSHFQEIEFVIYDQNFDELGKFEKCRAICLLLDTLPSIDSMRDYLLKRGGAEVHLRDWTERLSPAALGLLRWIIASNRSCIVQVDNLEDSHRKSEERVYGMPGWMQFRLAQGAPDKEQRFVQSIRETTAEMRHPTLFAWHGSPLPNWHGIVREGLHFEHTSHGRAYGNGVYHALDVSTSLGYSGMHTSYPGMPGNEDSNGNHVPGRWPPSQLRISQALTLNEIVNAPDKYVSRNPHLVVAQLDWIQSRYLFVMCNTKEYNLKDSKPTKVLGQDPQVTPFGVKREKLMIPLNAISRSRRPTEQATSTTTPGDNKKRKIDEPLDEEAPLLLSDDTDEEDSKIFHPSKPTSSSTPANPAKRTAATNKSKEKSSSTPLTDFTPGSHPSQALPLLSPPSYATTSATRTLQRELTSTLKTLDTHPAHELGWYLDRELVTNMYQWIIELHSFEPHLPLAADLRAKSLRSVLLELRFGKDYPMTPPFVRIVRPRFLSFMQGGGGHVTAGGALCMELLTNSGWSAVSNIESVLLQVRLALSSTDPKPARLEQGPVRDYGTTEAVEAYLRACRQHGWQVPPDFQASYGGGGSSASN